jgi:inorganic triphosphatase YgiF
VTKADQVERELKLGAWPEFVLPDLNGFVDGAKPGEPERHDLDAVYYDTPDLKLLRRGATLRFRRGEPPSDLWTAKLPSDASAQGLARREISVSGRRDVVPKQFVDVMRGWALGRALRPVARVSTTREAIPLCDDGGRMLATMDDDTVTVRRGRRVVARFRELEVELVGDAPAEILGAIDEALRSAGAEHVAQIPKLTRALGREAALPWDLEVPPLGSKTTMAQAAQSRLRVSVAHLVDLHAPLVLDAEDSAQRARDVVQAVGAKLDLFAALLEPEQSEPMREELRRLDNDLARVAELDALLARAPQASDARKLSARLGDARARAHATLLRSLRARPYVALLERLAEIATKPPLETDAGRRRAAPAAGKFVRPLWRELRHEEEAPARRVAKLEAAVELAAAVLDEEAQPALERVRELRTLIAEHDRLLAMARRLRAIRRRLDPDESWAAGMLAGTAAAQADAIRARFPAVWQNAADKAIWNWAD